MGICEKEGKEKKYNAIEKENNRLNETIEKVEKSKINKINQPKKIINECIIQNSPLVNIDSKVANVSKSICKIKCLENGHGTGFFLIIPFFDDWNSSLKALMTNYNV